MYMDNYTEKSLELHLFFGRIMKEHALFLKAGFTPAAASFSTEAEAYKREFEYLLSNAVALGNGVVSPQVLHSGELVTEFTTLAESQTEKLTGIAIDKGITARELQLSSGNDSSGNPELRYGRGGNYNLELRSGNDSNGNPELRRRVQQLNQRAWELLNGLISFKERILNNVLTCKMFTMNYPLLIEHILREARLYRDYVEILETQGSLPADAMRDIECFWNQIMMEHALFIRGLLDPTEAELIQTADSFAVEYADLLETCSLAHTQTMTTDTQTMTGGSQMMTGGSQMMTGGSLEETLRFRDFKIAGTKGIEECGIRSLILPLLADHVLREANHYVRLLTVQ